MLYQFRHEKLHKSKFSVMQTARLSVTLYKSIPVFQPHFLYPANFVVNSETFFCFCNNIETSVQYQAVPPL